MQLNPSFMPSQKNKHQKEEQPKVVIAAHLPPSVGGPASLLINIFSSTLGNDFKIIPFNIGRPPKVGVRNNFGYNIIFNAGIRRGFVAIWLTLRHIFEFPILLSKEQPTLAHIHTVPFWVFWETACYVLMCRLFRVPCALQMHFSFRFFYNRSSWLLRRLMLRILQLTCVFVVICKDDIAFLKELGAKEINTTYLPNFVDVNKIQADIKKTLCLKPHKESLEILFLGGSDTTRKGLPDLLFAIPSLADRFPHLHFRLVAVPPDLVSELVPEVYQNRCIVEGWISGHEKYERFGRADIFVLPTHAEGMPIAILEAMAGAIPVVASNIAGIPDMIRDGQEGFLIPSGNVPALVNAINKLLESKDLRSKLGNRAAARVIQKYDLHTGIENFKRLYASIINGEIGNNN